MTPTPAAPSIERIVLDTNAVLDWLVFANPACLDWQQQLASGSVRWLVTAEMRVELAHVLGRAAMRARGVDAAQIWRVWDCYATLCPAAATEAVPILQLRCTDPSDQMFIDLAIAQGAHWLITRDRAVLKLARGARRFGLSIATPDHYGEAQESARRAIAGSDPAMRLTVVSGGNPLTLPQPVDAALPSP